MPAKDKILIVEDEKGILSFMTTVLTSNGYDVISANSGAKAITLVTSHCPDLVILDLGLPDMDGMEVLRRLRKLPATRRVPVIMITARGSEYDRVKGLDEGADDYIVKPFGIMELISRVKALLRRTDERSGDVISVGPVEINVRKHSVTSCSEIVTLTLKEYELLYLLMKNPDTVYTRDMLLSSVWGYDFDGETRTVDVHIRTLRSKLKEGGRIIETVRGVGYRASDDHLHGETE